LLLLLKHHHHELHLLFLERPEGVNAITQ